MARTIRLLLCFSLVLASIVGAAAQSSPPFLDTNPRHFDAPYFGTRVTLGPSWLVSLGDNPAFASPTYDDSAWRTISSDKLLSDYGIQNASYVWYRIHVHIRPNARYIAVETQFIQGGYEVYINGVRIGSCGPMSGSLQSVQNYLASYNLPENLSIPDGNLLVALRFALNRAARNGVGNTTPFHTGGVFLATQDAATRDAGYEAVHQNAIYLVNCGLSLVVGLVALALYLAMRSRWEYLAIAVSLLAAGLQQAQLVWVNTHLLTAQGDVFVTLWLGISNVALIEFVRLILSLRRSPWLIALMVANFLGYFASNLNNTGFLPILPTLIAYFLPALIVKAVLTVLLFQGLLRGNRDARVIFPAIAVVSIANYWYCLFVAKNVWQWPVPIPPLPNLHIATYSLDVWDVWSVIYCVTLLLFLVLRTIGIARERARVAAELEAARAVQHVLIPDEIPTVPGFALDSVYKPAGEVGGDFFQISPLQNGGVLVVIGDVSGKGMPAAMTVSLLVGTFRTLAHYTHSPAEILAAMNTRMLARSHGGFTTCLVLRADPDGALTIANAGHIAPYLDGKELSVDNGLPLGLAASAAYIESAFRFTPGQQLTLITDGVVEARDKNGALFGFDRSAALSHQTAPKIAQAAQAFGQEDDITVLTLISTTIAAPAVA